MAHGNQTELDRPLVAPSRTDLPATLSVGTWWRAALLGGAALALALGLLAAIWFLARPLALLLAAIVLAEALRPIVNALDRWLPRTLAIVLTYLALLLVLGVVVWLIVPALIGEAWWLLGNTPGMIDEMRLWLEDWLVISTEQVANTLLSYVNQLVGILLSLPLLLVSVAAEALLVFVISIYWLIGSPRLNRFVLSLIPLERQARVTTVLGRIGHSMGGYVRGVAINAVIVSTLTYTGLLMIGLEYALVLALLAGFSEIIPVLGPAIAAVPAVGIGLLDSPTKAIIVLVFYILLQQFEGNVLMPRVMQEQTNIPPVLGLFALTAGAGLGGILGALIALPTAGAIRVLAVDVLAPAVRRWSGAGRPAIPVTDEARSDAPPGALE